MHERLGIDFAGERLELLAARAIHWPAQQCLLIADLHLGKADVFRQSGIAIPTGGTGEDLARLEQLISLTGARTLYLLGDVIHGPLRPSPWLAQWTGWRRRHAALQMVAIPGNHDRQLEAGSLGIALAAQALDLGPLQLRHAPAAAGHPCLCGHLHPVVRLPRIPGRHPAFVVEPRQIILPAFSAFTGGLQWAAQPQQQLFACLPQGIVALPRGTPARR